MSASAPAPGESFCAVHNVRHGYRGCPLCRRLEVVERNAEESHLLKRAAVVIGPLLLAALVYGFWPASNADLRLDPEPYRQDIEALESVLYRPVRLDAQDRDTLLNAALALMRDLRGALPTRARVRAAEAIEPFAGMLVTLADMEFDVDKERSEWERLRDENFSPADWFLHGSPALAKAQVAAAQKGAPKDAELYRHALDELEMLANRIAVGCGQLPEDPYALDMITARPWDQAKREAKLDLERIQQNYPVHPVDVDPQWVAAHRALERARSAVEKIFLGDIHTPTLVPTRSEAERRIQGVRRAIEQARSSLAAAEG